MLTRTLALLTTTVTTFLVGCSNAHKYEFAVNIKNDTPEPVTVWLTKQGGPPEEGWLSPEAVESTRPAKLGHINGVVVPAGKKHNFLNTGQNPLILYTVYGPPEHADGAVHKTKEEADRLEEEGKDEPPGS